MKTTSGVLFVVFVAALTVILTVSSCSTFYLPESSYDDTLKIYDVSVSFTDIRGEVEEDPTADVFAGSTTVNTPLDITFAVTNSGNSTITFSGSAVQISGQNFSLKSDLPSKIEVNATETFEITFLSDTAGTFSADISVNGILSGTDVFTSSIYVDCTQ